MEVRKTVVAGVIAAVVVACSGPARDALGGAMQDAGDAMQDTGRELVDAGSEALAGAGAVLGDAGHALTDAGAALVDAGHRDSGSAAAAEPMIVEADCDTESGVRVVQPDDSWTETVSFYASADVDGPYAESHAGVVALLCNWEGNTAALGAPECQGDVDCVERGDYPRPAPDCKQTAEIEINDGGHLTVNCGTETDSSSGLPGGGHWNFVRFVLPAR